MVNLNLAGARGKYVLVMARAKGGLSSRQLWASTLVGPPSWVSVHAIPRTSLRRDLIALPQAATWSWD